MKKRTISLIIRDKLFNPLYSPFIYHSSKLHREIDNHLFILSQVHNELTVAINRLLSPSSYKAQKMRPRPFNKLIFNTLLCPYCKEILDTLGPNIRHKIESYIWTSINNELTPIVNIIREALDGYSI